MRTPEHVRDAEDETKEIQVEGGDTGMPQMGHGEICNGRAPG